MPMPSSPITITLEREELEALLTASEIDGDYRRALAPHDLALYSLSRDKLRAALDSPQPSREQRLEEVLRSSVELFERFAKAHREERDENDPALDRVANAWARAADHLRAALSPDCKEVEGEW